MSTSENEDTSASRRYCRDLDPEVIWFEDVMDRVGEESQETPQEDVRD